MNNKEKKWYFLWRNNNNIFPPEIPRSFVPTGNLCEFHHLVARNFIYSSLIWFENILLTLFYIFPRGDISKFYCGYQMLIQLLWKYPSMEELSLWYLNEYYLTRNWLIWGIMLCGEESVLLIYDISIASKNGLFETV